MSPGEVLRTVLLATVLLGVIGFAFYDSLLPVPVFSVPASLILLRRQRTRLMRKRKHRLKQQFLYGAALLSDDLRSGSSIENALRKSRRELGEVYGANSDILREWQQMGAKLQLNLPVEEAMADFGHRSGISEIRDFSEVFGIVKRSGGQLGEVLSSVCSSLSEQFAAEEEIRTALTAGRLEQKIMDLMPLAIILYVRLSSPEFLRELYQGLAGRAVMTGCLLVYGAAYLWSERILKIEV